MAKTVKLSFVHKGCTLTDFNYRVLISRRKKDTMEVVCDYQCNGKPVSLTIYYPNDYRKTNEAFIKRAEKLISMLANNKELFKYSEAKLKKVNYKINVPTSYGFFGFTDIAMFTPAFYKQYNEDKKKLATLNEDEVKVNKKDLRNIEPENRQEKPKKVKSHKGAIVFLTILALAGLGFSGYSLYYYFTKIKPGGGGTDSNNVNIIYNLKDGTTADGQHFVANTVKKGTTWADVKKDAPTDIKYDASYSFKNFTVGNTELYDGYTFKENTTIDANYIIKEPSNFESDGFLTIANVADNGVKSGTKTIYGLEALKQVYGKTNDFSFIGKEKTIEMNGLKYIVRVIGEDHDVLTDSTTGEDKAALTFEFKNVVEPGTSYSSEAVNTNAYDKDNNMHRYLNNDFVSMLPSDVQKSLKSVKKNTAQGGNKTFEERKEITGTNEKVFSLSSSELGVTDDYPYKEPTPVLKEGNIYQYYNLHKSEEGVYKKTRVDSTETFSYLLRSPDYATNCFSWVVNGEGKIGEKQDNEYGSVSVTEARAVSPCFCIGGHIAAK